jgi:hypothetical protein
MNGKNGFDIGDVSRPVRDGFHNHQVLRSWKRYADTTNLTCNRLLDYLAFDWEKT